MLNPNSIVYLFGYYSLWIGVANLLPIPALDGGYLWLFWLEKFMTRAKAFKLIQSIVSWGFKIMMFLNIICFIYLIVLAIIFQL
jgi:regulator of sigma E protease